MKKSRITKLALSGAAVAALAATFSTSTYAWYVSNKTAEVTGGSGTTGAAGSDGSVLVSWIGGTGDVWFKSIDFADDTDKVANALSPIHYDSTGTAGFYGITDTGTKSTSVSNAYIQFVVHIKTGSATTVTPTINLTVSGSNTQKAYVDDTAYVTPKAYSDSATYYAANSTYATITLTSETYVANKYYILNGTTGIYELASGEFSSTATYYEYKTTYTAAAAGTVTSSNYSNYYLKCENCLPDGVEKGASFSVTPLKSIWVQQTVTDNASTHTSYFSADNTSAGGDAHAYYTAVTGYTPWATSPSAGENNGLHTISTAADTDYAITYTIFLDGGDVDCYNSNAGYSLAFDLSFTL